MKYSVIIPSLWRIESMKRAVASVGDGCEIVVVAGDDDTARACATLPVVCVPGGDDAIKSFNLGGAAATGDWLVVINDDLTLYPNWREEVERTPNTGFVGLYEGITWTTNVGMFAVARELALRVLGGVIYPPCYRSWWADHEVCDRIRAAGAYAVTKAVVAYHYHHSLGRSPDDAVYARGKQWHAQDEQTYKRRKREGFPITWAPVLQEQHANPG